MIGAVLPLPRNPQKEMQEQDNSTRDLGFPGEREIAFNKKFGPTDEARYESARWWRAVNRWMSIVGFLIIAAVVCFPLTTPSPSKC